MDRLEGQIQVRSTMATEKRKVPDDSPDKPYRPSYIEEA